MSWKSVVTAMLVVGWCGAAAPGAETADDGDGSDENVEEKTIEAAKPAPDAWVPIDLRFYNAKQQWKKELRARTGIDFALESTTIYQIASGGGDANDAMVNTTGLFSTWSMWQHANGIDRFGIGFQAETRDNFSGSSFQDMTAENGTLWSPNDSTSDDYAKINQLWFGQKYDQGKYILLVGKIDPGSEINGNRYAGSGNTQFFSQPFATNPGRAFPDNGLGVLARYTPNQWMHVQAAFSDSSAVGNHSPITTIDGNWFYTAELVLKPKLTGLGVGHYRFLLYYRDTSPDATTGWSISFDQDLGDRFGVFLRYGGNDGDAGAISHIVSTGAALRRPLGRANDQSGIGVSWTHPADSDLRDEYSAETYYRMHLTEFLEVSASAQLVLNPSANEGDDAIGVFGLRMRVLF